MERNHFSLRVFHAQLQHIVDVLLGILTRTKLHLIDASELHEIVHIRLPQIVGQGREYLIQIQVHKLHLVPIDVQVVLRYIRLIHATERSNGRLGAILGQQGIDRFLQLFGSQCLTVFKFELEPARVTHAGDDRRNDAEHLRLLHHTVCLPIESIDYRLCGMFLARTFLPILQHHEVSGRIGKLTSTHHTESVHTQEGLDFGILLQDGIHLLTYCLGSFQGRSSRELDRHDEVSVIFFGHEGGRPFHEHHQGYHR